MTNVTRSIATGGRGKPSALKALWNMSILAVATFVEVAAALELDGWLSVALWALAAKNTTFFVLASVGIAELAAEADQRRIDDERTQ